jgi:hypothetical protein
VLMQQHNLEYPRFYGSLYKQLKLPVLYARHRPMFFRLLRVCLQSTHVPAYVIAAFMKRSVTGSESLAINILSTLPCRYLAALAHMRKVLDSSSLGRSTLSSRSEASELPVRLTPW